jgi:hypothetical protein
MEKIIKECSRCSAPLIEIDGQLHCQYCGASYYLPDDVKKYHEQEKSKNNKNDPLFQKNIENVEIDINTHKKSIGTRIFIFLAIFIAILAIFLVFKTKPREEISVSPEQKFEQNWKNESSYSLVGFHHGAILSSAVSFVRVAEADWTHEHLMIFDLVIINNSDEVIQTNLKDFHLQISEVVFVDNFGNTYACNYYPKNYDALKPGIIYDLGWMECPKHLPPEVKFLDFSIDFINWGSFDYVIPIVTNTDLLKIDYGLNAPKRSQNNEFTLHVSFNTVESQNISLYFDSISVIDDYGTIYKPYFCHSGSQEWGEGLMIGEPHTYMAFNVSNSSLEDNFTCSFEGPFPYDSDFINVAMTIRGKSIVVTVPIDNIDGYYELIREPSE